MQVTTLRSYLAETGMSYDDFGKLVDYHPRYLYAIAMGKKMPSEKLARNIFRATNGVIQLKTKKTEKKSESD